MAASFSRPRETIINRLFVVEFDVLGSITLVAMGEKTWLFMVAGIAFWMHVDGLAPAMELQDSHAMVGTQC